MTQLKHHEYETREGKINIHTEEEKHGEIECKEKKQTHKGRQMIKARRKRERRKTRKGKKGGR